VGGWLGLVEGGEPDVGTGRESGEEAGGSNGEWWGVADEEDAVKLPR
jgi:hypothetical protein